MKSLLHIPYFMVGFITHQRTVEVKKSEGAISNGKSFDGTGSASKSGMGTKISSGPPSFHRP